MLLPLLHIVLISKLPFYKDKTLLSFLRDYLFYDDYGLCSWFLASMDLILSSFSYNWDSRTEDLCVEAFKDLFAGYSVLMFWILLAGVLNTPDIALCLNILLLFWLDNYLFLSLTCSCKFSIFSSLFSNLSYIFCILKENILSLFCFAKFNLSNAIWLSFSLMFD